MGSWWAAARSDAFDQMGKLTLLAVGVGSRVSLLMVSAVAILRGPEEALYDYSGDEGDDGDDDELAAAVAEEVLAVLTVVPETVKVEKASTRLEAAVV